MSRLGLPAVVLGAGAISAATHYVGVAYFVIGVCGVSDTADTFPAEASPQGLVCDAGQRADWWGAVGYLSLAASAVLAVVVAGLVWHRGRARGLAFVVPLAAPVLTVALLAVPPDTCSEDTARTEPAHACRTTPG